jgi:hypothetical protein
MAIRSEGTIYTELVASVEAKSPVPLDLGTDTVEGSILTAVSTAAAQVEQAAQLARDDSNAATATGDALTSIAAGQGVFRRGATQSRYETRAVDGPATLTGTEIARGGGPDGRTTWAIITTGLVNAGDTVIVEAVEAGAIALGGATTLDLVTTVPGLTELEWDPGVDPAGQVGRDRETDAQLRARLALGGGGLRQDVRALEWVTAATSATTGAGTLLVTVAPGPVGADQTAELVDTIGPYVLGVVTQGSQTGNYTAPDGTVTVIAWNEGTTIPIPVTLTVTRASGVSLASVEDAVEAAIDGYFATLEIGDVVIRQRVIAAALTVDGVTDVTACTLNAVAGNYTPALTSIVTLASVVVS